MKAIETRYKGYRFRSRLEARWAVFFDALGYQWEYEPEGFDLGEAGWYLPDFFVQRRSDSFWLEIKGTMRNITYSEWKKMLAFSSQSEAVHATSLVLGVGVPGEKAVPTLSGLKVVAEQLARVAKQVGLTPGEVIEHFEQYPPRAGTSHAALMQKMQPVRDEVIALASDPRLLFQEQTPDATTRELAEQLARVAKQFDLTPGEMVEEFEQYPPRAGTSHAALMQKMQPVRDEVIALANLTPSCFLFPFDLLDEASAKAKSARFGVGGRG